MTGCTYDTDQGTSTLVVTFGQKKGEMSNDILNYWLLTSHKSTSLPPYTQTHGAGSIHLLWVVATWSPRPTVQALFTQTSLAVASAILHLNCQHHNTSSALIIWAPRMKIQNQMMDESFTDQRQPSDSSRTYVDPSLCDEPRGPSLARGSIIRFHWIDILRTDILFYQMPL